MSKDEDRYIGGRKAYLDKNREKLRAQERARYARNPKSYAAKKKAYRIANLERLNLCQRKRYWKNVEASRKRNRDRWLKRREKALVCTRKYYRENRDRILKQAKDYRSSVDYKLQRALKARLRRKTDIHFKIETNCRNRIVSALKGKGKSKRTVELLGCSIENFKIYIESLFWDGMCWGNYGRGKGKWNLDHIMPCAIFDLSKPSHQKRCFHFSNYQPLWETDNHKKSDSVISDQFRLL